MSTILFQKPSTDSSHVVEATTLRLKLVSPKSNDQKTVFPGWNLLQSPPSHKPIDDYFNHSEINSYFNNQQSLKLSQKSLELCTESLGSETGSDTSDDYAIFAFQAPSLSVTKSRRVQTKPKKVLTSRSFPPPLTSMSGSKLFHVRPHREGGRLIIEAMETILGNKCLRVERSNGRLRLTCWKSQEDDENDMKDFGDEMVRNAVVHKFQRVRRCNEDENGICCNLEPSSWVATS